MSDFSYYEIMIPINLNYEICLESTRKGSPSLIRNTGSQVDIKEAIKEEYMIDITTQYIRDVKINELWKSLEVEI